MSGARVGEQESAVGGASRRRRSLVAGAVVLMLLVVFVGSALTNEWFSEYPRGACKGVGYGAFLTAEPDPAAVHATPEAALAAFAPKVMQLGPQPVPADGWQEYRGRWVRDMGDGSFYEMDVHERANGWVASGDFLFCGR